MDETASFDGDRLQLLVLDEVDRLMDLGFKDAIDQIMNFLPKNVQTMLFSATIGNKVQDLVKVNLSDEHQYLGMHDYVRDAEDGDDPMKSITPVRLLHYCMKVPI
jgi:ATP-dependent RNA helicase DDX10/DBP4